MNKNSPPEKKENFSRDSSHKCDEQFSEKEVVYSQIGITHSMCNDLKDDTIDAPYGCDRSMNAGDDEIRLAPKPLDYATYERRSSWCVRRREAGVMAEESHSESVLV